jgi:hypothetical protein
MAEDATERKPSPWRVPLTLAGAGLVLMLTGYALLRYAPGPSREDADPHLEQLRKMAEKDPTQRELADRLRAVEGQDRGLRGQPLRLAGGVAFYTGLLLFLAAGLRMYRQPAEPKSPQEQAEENPQI